MSKIWYQITDSTIEHRSVLIEVDSPEDVDAPEITKDQAFFVVEFWEQSTAVGGRSSYDLTDDGIIMLAEVESAGDDIEMFAWYIEDTDWPLASFPSTTLSFTPLPE
jgi:hypothetical protein